MSVLTPYKIVNDLWKRNRIFCSSDYDASLEYLSSLLPFQIHEYHSKEPYKGWVIPPKWELIKGTIKCGGKVIFEAKHPLDIIGLSNSFHGKVSLEELKKHLHFDLRNPDRVPYHFRQHYRPWQRDWGFCVTKRFFDSLQANEYEVEIEVKESEGYLKVAEYTKKGKTPYTFAFVAHLDHPSMANDDLAGVAVGVELFRKLKDLDTKFSYRLVIVQEIIGSVFYLDKTAPNQSPVLETCFLEMLGSKTPFALQASKEGNSHLEQLIEQSLMISSYRKGPFRSIICNDEMVWESAGIPMSSLSRYPYDEYHSNADTIDIIDPLSLEESVSVLWDAIQKLEKSILMEKHFEGVYSLSHPDYQLYVDPGEPAFSRFQQNDNIKKMRLLMDLMPTFPKTLFVDQIATKVGLPAEDVLHYLRLWQDKKLITLH